MRGDDDGGQLKEWRLGAGLLLEDVEGGTLDVTVTYCRSEVGFVNDATTSDVDVANAGLALLQRLGIQEVGGLFVLG